MTQQVGWDGSLLYGDGGERREWSQYITRNPVSGQAWMDQTGASGVYFRGEVAALDNGRRTQTGVVFLPDGRAKSVRDEIEILADDRYKSHVFERADDGSWRKAREWTWTRLPESDAAR